MNQLIETDIDMNAKRQHLRVLLRFCFENKKEATYMTPLNVRYHNCQFSKKERHQNFVN